MLVGLWNCINSFLIEHAWKIYLIDSHGDVGRKWAAYFLPKSFLGGRREPAAKKGSLRCQTLWSWCHEQSVDGAEPGLCLGPLVSDIWSTVKQNFNASAFLLLSISDRGSNGQYFPQIFCQNSAYFWEFLPKILRKILHLKARHHDILDKKARKWDICDKINA